MCWLHPLCGGLFNHGVYHTPSLPAVPAPHRCPGPQWSNSRRLPVHGCGTKKRGAVPESSGGCWARVKGWEPTARTPPRQSQAGAEPRCKGSGGGVRSKSRCAGQGRGRHSDSLSSCQGAEPGQGPGAASAPPSVLLAALCSPPSQHSWVVCARVFILTGEGLLTAAAPRTVARLHTEAWPLRPQTHTPSSECSVTRAEPSQPSVARSSCQ